MSRLETLISTLYHSLNKRLPAEQHINIQASTSTLLNWLLAAYDRYLEGGTGIVNGFRPAHFQQGVGVLLGYYSSLNAFIWVWLRPVLLLGWDIFYEGSDPHRGGRSHL